MSARCPICGAFTRNDRTTGAWSCRRCGTTGDLALNAHDDPVQTGERVRGRRAAETLPTSTPKTGDSHE